MKAFIPIYAISILLGTNAFGNSQSSTAEGVDKEITINRLMSKVPQGATVTDTSCKEIGTAGFNIRYRCTITWQWVDVINEGPPGPSLSFHIHNCISCIEILFSLDLLHGRQELFHQSAHEIDRCKQPDDLDHGFIMPKSKRPGQIISISRKGRSESSTGSQPESKDSWGSRLTLQLWREHRLWSVKTDNK